MRKSVCRLIAIFAVAVVPLSVQAETVSVVEGGQTSVLFGNGALESLGLAIAGVDGDVVAPGELGPFSVAFPINARDAAMLPTTFEYDGTDFAPFAGTIEHMGEVELTDAATSTASITVGDFTIGYDAARVDGDATGFFVQDNVDTGAILFDIANPIVEAFDTVLVIAADILVSSELSGLLNEQGLIDFDATGADAGMALVVADASVIPVPAAVWMFGSALGLLAWVRRRA
jgi:hypothetical protein